MKMKTLEIFAGSGITRTIAKAIEEATLINDQVEFEFNGTTIQVAADSNPVLIYRDWQRGLLRPDGFTVLAYPPLELSAEQIAEDARLKAEQEERHRQSAAKYAEEAAIKTATLESALSTAPPLALRDADAWQAYVTANSDGYGAACVRYAEKWGRLMQTQIPEGNDNAPAEVIASVADECSHLADDEGITGFMYGAAVSMLAQAWIYGEELRRWHNLKTQIGTEGERANESGGVLNPALLSIG